MITKISKYLKLINNKKIIFIDFNSEHLDEVNKIYAFFINLLSTKSKDIIYVEDNTINYMNKSEKIKFNDYINNIKPKNNYLIIRDFFIFSSSHLENNTNYNNKNLIKELTEKFHTIIVSSTTNTFKRNLNTFKENDILNIYVDFDESKSKFNLKTKNQEISFFIKNIKHGKKLKRIYTIKKLLQFN